MDFMCLEFINTQWYTKHRPFKEYLEDQVWLDMFCSNWNIPVTKASPRVIRTLKSVRNNLFGMARQLVLTKTIPQESIAKLNGYLRYGTFRQRLSSESGRFRIERISRTKGLNRIICDIALSFADLLSNYQLEYLKECRNPDCDWIFYDDSKNHSRKWCDNRCATLMKVREYRARKKLGQTMEK